MNTKRVPSPLVLAFVLLAPFCAPAGESGRLKAVWLTDSTLGIPFCRLMIPERWIAEGNVYWNPNTPMAAFSVWARLTDPDSGMTVEILNPIGAFAWNEMKNSVTRGQVRDGVYEYDTGVYNLRYRNAETLLREFLLPAIARMTPGARQVGGFSRNPQEEESLRRSLQNDLRAAAGVARIAGSEATSGHVVVEHGNLHSLVGCGSYGYHSVSSVPYMGTFRIYNWRWANIYSVTAPKNVPLSYDPVRTYFTDNCVFNPAWVSAVSQFVTALAQKRMGTIIRINEDARRALRRSGEVMEQNADRWSRYILDQSLWADPQGQTYLGPNSGKYGYITGFGDALVLSDTEVLGANLHGLRPLTQID